MLAEFAAQNKPRRFFRRGFYRLALRVPKLAVVGETEDETRRGDRVRFRLSNAFLPEAESVLKALSLDTEVDGSITDFSDSGAEANAFALVKVVRQVTVVVACGNLELFEEGPESDNG